MWFPNYLVSYYYTWFTMNSNSNWLRSRRRNRPISWLFFSHQLLLVNFYAYSLSTATALCRCPCINIFLFLFKGQLQYWIKGQRDATNTLKFFNWSVCKILSSNWFKCFKAFVARPMEAYGGCRNQPIIVECEKDNYD